MQPVKYTYTFDDFKRNVLNLVIFSAPAFVLFLVALQAKFTAQGALVAVFVLNFLIDAVKKFIAEHPQN